jgi:hypothetical protein
MNNEICEHCGAALKKYWHSMTPGLVKILVKCYAYASTHDNLFKMKDLELDHSEYGNFQKLRFHGLIAKHKVSGDVEERVWLLTHRGAEFLKGEIQVPAKVQTFRNRVVGHDEELVTINQVMKNTPYWEKDFSYDIFEPKQTVLI